MSLYTRGYAHAKAITKHDTNKIGACEELWVGGTGSLVIITRDGVTVTILAVPAGSRVPIRADVITTASTATSIIALY